MDHIVCPECGAENHLDAVHCESCGADLEAVKSLVDSANTHYNEALALAHAGKLDEAIGQLEAALSMNAQNPNYHNLLGTLYAQKGLFSESIRAWERCLALDPEMEKAYHNIEKAHDMEAEYAEDQVRRPFLLASISGGIAAAVLLVVALYFGVNLYFKSSQVNELQAQVISLKESNSAYKNEVENFNKYFPDGGVTGMLSQMDALRGQIAEKEKQIEEAKTSYESQLERRQEIVQRLNSTITDLRNQVAEKDSLVQQINNQLSVINTHNRKIAQLEKELADTQEKLKTETERAAGLVEKLKVAQETSNGIREDKERAITNLKASQETIVEQMRQENLDRLAEIGVLERKIQDMEYASNLVVEALKNVEANQFELAGRNVRSALNRVPEMPAAVFVHQTVQEILADPLEQVRRIERARQMKQKQAEERMQFAKEYLARANESLKDGNYDQTIELADYAVQLVNDDSVRNEGTQLRKTAEEKKTQLVTKMAEVKRLIANQEYKKAESMLKDILKTSRYFREAQELLNEIGSLTS